MCIVYGPFEDAINTVRVTRQWYAKQHRDHRLESHVEIGRRSWGVWRVVLQRDQGDKGKNIVKRMRRGNTKHVEGVAGGECDVNCGGGGGKGGDLLYSPIVGLRR